jgi:2-polyprenyl-3-methyl-5-hydroxy-6-metoxy-1,4-benzoquinol methylase
LTTAPLLPLDLSERRLQEEIMDDPGLEPAEHLLALRALTMVNRLSLTAERAWREVRRLAKARRSAGGGDPRAGGRDHPVEGEGTDSHRPLRILDVACGGGDTVLALKRRGERAGIPLEVQGCDVSPVALEHARKQARREGVEASFFELDALTSSLPSGFDLVCSSLFLHHLEEEEVVRLLAGMAEAGKTLLLQDLRRTRAGYWLAHGTLRLLSRSRVAQVDGPRSVQASFRIPEVKALARRAGLDNARIVPCWPQRFVLTWNRK